MKACLLREARLFEKAGLLATTDCLKECMIVAGLVLVTLGVIMWLAGSGEDDSNVPDPDPMDDFYE